MATTTNYGWDTPDDTDLVKDGAAAIRTLGSSVDTTTKNLNPQTTTGALAYRSATANVNTALPIGTTSQVLTVVGGVPAWATPAAGSFVGVMVNNSATQNVANSTDTFPTFNQEVFDTDAFHSTSVDTNRLTVPAGLGGYYLITGYVSFEGNATGYRQAGYRINGSTEITPVLYSSNGTATATLNFQHIANLSAGDYVEMRLVQSSGGTLFIYGGGSTRFGMAKL
jgi:hypothetical protein